MAVIEKLVIAALALAWIIAGMWALDIIEAYAARQCRTVRAWWQS